jgi:two-component system sensor histidine kinase PilS (NtrC family)
VSHAPANTSSTAQPEQPAALARIYCWYRPVLAAILLAGFFGSSGHPLLGREMPRLFVALSSIYLLLSVIQLILALRRPPGRHQLLLLLLLDIGYLIGLTHASGGLTSGLAPLLLVAMAAAGLMLSGQFALLSAALATLGLLGAILYQIETGTVSSHALLPGGTLGILFFATAIGFHLLGQRLQSTQRLAQQRALDVSKLQHLNQMIVQRMRTGILVVDDQFKVKMLNQAAAQLLRADDWQRQIAAGQRPPLDQRLLQRLLWWQQDPATPAPTFVGSESGPELITRFAALDPEASGDTLIFLEDAGQLAQRAQQLKLAALGRLTASIAHEIRNPLGAVSHAAQLLLESEELVSGDRRLAEIVQHHSRRLNAVIENILQLSRREPPNPVRLRLDEWLPRFLDDYRLGCNGDCEVTIVSDSSAEVTVDPGQLSQVLTNLIDNAIRHSAKAGFGRKAELRLSASADQLAILEVIDLGPGLDDSSQEKVFEPFFTTEAKGSGLGLYIARELCEINQARLNFVRTEDGESCFRINFSHPDRKPLIHE